MGRSAFAPLVFNCNAPDTGNMEVLLRYGTQAQRDEWLEPLLDGRIRSAFTMTEPGVASSDATNMEATAVVDGDEVVVNGRKWWSTGVGHPDCRIFVFMGLTDPDADRHHRHTMVLVPRDTPGVRIERLLTTMGYADEPIGHGEVSFTDVRVPAANILSGPGEAFAIAQGRLGPGRIHHCMRLIGAAEAALELACRRGLDRTAFGKPLVDLGGNRERIAEARIAIEQARLLVLHAAWKLDEGGSRERDVRGLPDQGRRAAYRARGHRHGDPAARRRRHVRRRPARVRLGQRPDAAAGRRPRRGPPRPGRPARARAVPMTSRVPEGAPERTLRHTPPAGARHRRRPRARRGAHRRVPGPRRRGAGHRPRRGRSTCASTSPATTTGPRRSPTSSGRWGGLDVLVNNAGVAGGGRLDVASLDEWRWITDINLFGVVRGTRAFVPMLKAQRSGHVVNVASLAGLVHPAGMASYNAVKAAVVALTETTGHELAAYGVRASVVCPSYFRTGLVDRMRARTPRSAR